MLGRQRVCGKNDVDLPRLGEIAKAADVGRGRSTAISQSVRREPVCIKPGIVSPHTSRVWVAATRSCARPAGKGLERGFVLTEKARRDGTLRADFAPR